PGAEVGDVAARPWDLGELEGVVAAVAGDHVAAAAHVEGVVPGRAGPVIAGVVGGERLARARSRGRGRGRGRGGRGRRGGCRGRAAGSAGRRVDQVPVLPGQ